MINRNNYEEFFLLYVDRELDAPGRQAVENFVAQNPDLAVELDILMDATMLPEAVVYGGKEDLIRTEGESITEQNYEAFFLLYIDNELSAGKRAEVETFVLQHPARQEAFTTLKETVLKPERVSFGNKAPLYRTENKRVVYMKPWHLAAAAIFIGVCVGGWLLFSGSVPGNNPVAVASPASSRPGITTPADTASIPMPAAPQLQQPAERQQPGQTDLANVPLVPSKQPRRNTVKRQNEAPVSEPVLERFVVEKATPEVVPSHQPALVHQKPVNPKEPPMQAAGAGAAANSTVQNDIANLGVSTIENNSPYKTYPVAYKEINTNDDDRSLHVGMFDLNKTKVTTLFKKAGRVFGKKTNNLPDEDGKLQVASFEIETKNK